MSGVGTKRVLKLLIDTNVWLDYFLARTNATKPIVELLFSRGGSGGYRPLLVLPVCQRRLLHSGKDDEGRRPP